MNQARPALGALPYITRHFIADQARGLRIAVLPRRRARELLIRRSRSIRTPSAPGPVDREPNVSAIVLDRPRLAGDRLVENVTEC
jgi:hypothetical protein